MKKQWYEKYIGYMFGNGEILRDVYEYDDGRKCYEMYNPATKTGYICNGDYFRKHILSGTQLPK